MAGKLPTSLPYLKRTLAHSYWGGRWQSRSLLPAVGYYDQLAAKIEDCDPAQWMAEENLDQALGHEPADRGGT
jgi:hypothetical protein